MFQSGSVSLNEVYKFVQSHPDIPHKKQDCFSMFCQTYQTEISTVAEIPGWYVWVTAQDSIIDPIYVGRSFRGKTSNLKSRLHEEFFDEYVAFWATMAEPKQVEDKLCRKNLLIGYKEYRKS